MRRKCMFQQEVVRNCVPKNAGQDQNGASAGAHTHIHTSFARRFVVCRETFDMSGVGEKKPWGNNHSMPHMLNIQMKNCEFHNPVTKHVGNHVSKIQKTFLDRHGISVRFSENGINRDVIPFCPSE